ncbi:MAG: hypothetical protein M0036_17230 [Desulfobacteraceae bacterium]|nr:hypothetical protein [Desulfobacteraceae bacterium]
MKVIYYGLPHRFCENEACNCLFGFWSDWTQWLPFNGYFWAYKGAYLPALWDWLMGGWEGCA